MHKSFIIGLIFSVSLHTKNGLSGLFKQQLKGEKRWKMRWRA